MRLSHIIGSIFGLVLVVGAVGIGFVWSACRAYVPPDKCLVLIKKTGEPLAPGQKIADKGQKGIQREALGPGRYFFNPWLTEWKLEDLTTISAGDPQTWKAVFQEGDPDYQVPKMEGAWPQVGIVTSLAGKPWGKESEVVDPGYQGIQRNVLTPGTYRLNPRAFKVERVPAIVVPLGCCGVVTSQIGEMPGIEVITETTIGPDGETIEGERREVQKLAEQGQRGVLADILQPGIYYINPYVHKVSIVQVGYNEISQLSTQNVRDNIRFPSNDGFTIEIEVTVVWGRHPQHIPEMIARFGNVQAIKGILLGQIRSICRNVGSQYNSTDFIRGEKREQYQRAVTETLARVAAERDIEILIALIQNFEVHGGTAEVTEEMDLKTTIQRGYIAKEEEETRQKQKETAMVKADLETAQVQIEVAREQIKAETRKKVAEIKATGEKRAQEIDAQRDLEVARIERQIAELDADKTRVLGKAQADVEKLRNQAEADGKRMLIQAFGTGHAYNLYTFAQEFNPESIRLIFAGEGTFWTDLSRMQDAASLEILKTTNSPGK